MFIVLYFILYSFTLIMFSLVTHPIYYCCLLVVNSLIGRAICYLFLGFRWYALLFCLVYVGGVYVLFIFVSVFRPNTGIFFSSKKFYRWIFVISVIAIIVGFVSYYSKVYAEYSSYLCTMSEGNFYICMCLTLIFGFLILRLIMSSKFNHYR